MSDILATITPRPARRWVGVAIQVALGGLILSVAFAVQNAPFLVQAALLAFGLFMLVGALRLYRATEHYIELTETELRDSSGRVLATIDEITGVDRGAFAFKPSNGFLLHLRAPGVRAWVPGLWWRVGKFVGVGGVTPANEAKAVAEILSMLIAQRDASPD